MKKVKETEPNFFVISDNEIRGHVKDFLVKYRNPYSRERSYDFVHSLFAKYIVTPPDEKDREKVLDYLARNLYMFLASWGMLRNSFLLDSNYICLKGIYDIVCEKGCLLDVSISGSNAMERDEYVEGVYSLAKEIKQELDGVGVHEKLLPDGTKQYKRTTNTLVTKIMLVTLGCIPAYDANAVASLGEMNMGTSILADDFMGTAKKKPKDNLEKEAEEKAKGSIVDIYDFVKSHAGAFTDAKKNLGVLGYSDMKLADMVLWEFGAPIVEKENKVRNENAKKKQEEKIEKLTEKRLAEMLGHNA